MKNRNLFLIIIFLFFSYRSFSQLTVTPVTNLQNALQNSLLGPGVVVNNITYTGVPNSLAEFSGTSSIGIMNGLFIGTGTALTVDSGATFFMSDSSTGAGDTVDLATIASGTTFDAGVLEFDFKVQGDSVKFNFVFASEEYSDYANTGFNDVFGFFISGPGITGHQNIALVPGTALPVSINTINNGNSSAGVVPTGPCLNCNYYNDNTFGSSCAFDGMTTVLTATAAVQPCTFYHIKLAVANVNDGAFDSGIFLEANSFTPCGPVSIFNGLAPIEDTVHICNGNSVTLTSCKGPGYSWNTGDTTQSITVSQPGTYTVTVSEGNCAAVSTQVTVVADPGLAQPSVLQNGNQLSSSIINAAFIYEWFKDGTAINNSNNSNLLLTAGGCYQVKMTDSAGCSNISDSLCVTFTGMAYHPTQNFSLVAVPNPTGENMQVLFDNTNNEPFQLSLYDVSGKLIFQRISRGNSFSIMRQDIQPGIYFLELEQMKTKIFQRTKIIME